MQPHGPLSNALQWATPKFLTFLLAVSGLIAIVGCGQTGAPLPPSLKLPAPVTDLMAKRVANRVVLTWTMPKRTVDKLPLKGPLPVHICRAEGKSACIGVADLSFPIGKPATFEDPLPQDLAEGPFRSITYSIEVRNQRGNSAGPSNAAVSAAGLAPPSFAGLRAGIQTDGVLLQWRPTSLPGGEERVDIHRKLLSEPNSAKKLDQPSKAKSPFGSQTLAKEQTLTVHLPSGKDTGRALDPDAAFDQRYSYQVTRVTTVTLAGKKLEIEGTASAEIPVDTKDVFPPAPPVGLVVVPVSDEGAIDLSWTPNSEADVAGYVVYRRENGGQPERLSAQTGRSAETSAFRDSSAQAGHSYSYSVSAVDRDGNESSRSAEVTESLPAKP